MGKVADRKRRLERATAEVERIGRFLGISQSWGLLVQLGEVGSDNAPNAQGAIEIEWPRHYKRATLTFNAATMDGWSARELEEYTLHEMLHLAFAPLDDTLKELLGESGSVYMQYHLLREGIVDTMTGYILLARDGQRAVKT